MPSGVPGSSSLRARREESGQRDAERIDGLSHEQLLRDTELLLDRRIPGRMPP
jgi:hypothetical protein